MEELRNESYKEYAVRNSYINFAGNKLIYVFYTVVLFYFSIPQD